MYVRVSDLASAAEDDDEHEGHGHGDDVHHPQPGTLLCSTQHLGGQARLERKHRDISQRQEMQCLPIRRICLQASLQLAVPTSNH